MLVKEYVGTSVAHGSQRTCTCCVEHECCNVAECDADLPHVCWQGAFLHRYNQVQYRINTSTVLSTRYY